MREIEFLVFHCSESSWGDVEEIRKWHLERGWRDIGYNGVILNGHRDYNSFYKEEEDGLFEEGRSLNLSSYIEDGEVAAHVLNYNSRSLGICLIGKDKFTLKQFQVALSIARLFQGINPNIRIKGHYEMPTSRGKTCPNFSMLAFRDLLDFGNFSDEAIEDYLEDWLDTQ